MFIDKSSGCGVGRDDDDDFLKLKRRDLGDKRLMAIHSPSNDYISFFLRSD